MFVSFIWIDDGGSDGGGDGGGDGDDEDRGARDPKNISTKLACLKQPEGLICLGEHHTAH